MKKWIAALILGYSQNLFAVNDAEDIRKQVEAAVLLTIKQYPDHHILLLRSYETLRQFGVFEQLKNVEMSQQQENTTNRRVLFSFGTMPTQASEKINNLEQKMLQR
jgi:hypothetical protein